MFPVYLSMSEKKIEHCARNTEYKSKNNAHNSYTIRIEHIITLYNFMCNICMYVCSIVYIVQLNVQFELVWFGLVWRVRK